MIQFVVCEWSSSIRRGEGGDLTAEDAEERRGEEREKGRQKNAINRTSVPLISYPVFFSVSVFSSAFLRVLCG
jgi:hypothetical protein